MQIRKLNLQEQPPWNLLLLADPSKEIVQSYLENGECYVADDENEIIGVFVLIPTRPSTVEIVNIAVEESQQGKGLGKQLIEVAITIAKSKGYKTVEIGTGNSSIGQLYLYQKCGFRINWIDKDFFIKHYGEEIFENGIQCRDMIRLSLDL